MKTLLMAFLVGALLSSLCLSQEPTTAGSAPGGQQTSDRPAQSGQPNEPPHIAPGSVIPVQLTATVDAKKARTGDEVYAKVTQDMKAASGEIVLPKNTKVVGHITEAEARNKEQKESQVGIAFDRAVMKDGSVESLPMSIQAIIALPSQRSADDNSGGAGVPQAPGSAFPTSGAGRAGMGSQMPQPAPNPVPSSPDQTNNNGDQGNTQRSITVNTQGIVGIPNYELSTTDATQGSVVRSEKGNVKLESGTLMLLRVNQ